MKDNAFGYEIADGRYRVQKTEARYIRYIFEEIISGTSSNKIAEWLNGHGVRTRKETGRWTHGMISRLVHNKRYSGEAGYPKIVNKSMQDKAIRILDEKKNRNKRMSNSSKNRQSPFYKKIRCGKCGANVLLYEDKERRYWRCARDIRSHGMVCGVYYRYDGVLDEEIHEAAIAILNELVSGKIVLNPQGEKKHNHLQIIKIDTQIKHLMEDRCADFEKFDQLLKEKNSLNYDRYRFETSSETMMLKNRLKGLSVISKLDRNMIESFIKKILLYENGTLRFILWNDQEIDKKVHIMRGGKNG